MSAKAQTPRQVLPCDFCKAPVAPFGFAPPPQSGIQVRRPIKTCAAQACRDRAQDRVKALLQAHDPFAFTKAASVPDPAQDKPPPPAQGALF